MTHRLCTTKVDPSALRARLAELYECDPQAGTFTRKQSRSGCKAGAIAGVSHRGYRVMKVDGQTYLAHRLIWLWVHGEWPKAVIDHINGNPSDNNIANLRDVSDRVNGQNVKGAYRSNKATGLLGVSRNHNRWRATIRIYGVPRNLGTYATPEEAHAAYLTAKREHHEGNTL